MAGYLQTRQEIDSRICKSRLSFRESLFDHNYTSTIELTMRLADTIAAVDFHL